MSESRRTNQETDQNGRRKHKREAPEPHQQTFALDESDLLNSAPGLFSQAATPSEIMSRQPSSLLSRTPSPLLQRQASAQEVVGYPHLRLRDRNFAQLQAKQDMPVHQRSPLSPAIQRATLQRNGEEEAAKKIQAWIRAQKARKAARIQGEQVREQVRVRSEAPGIVGVRIRNTQPNALGDISGTPLAGIRSNLDQDTEYNHLKVLGGASKGGVFGPNTGQGPQTVSEIAQGANVPGGAAVINGGFFAHIPTIRSEEGWNNQANFVPQANDTDADRYQKAWGKNEELTQVGGRGRPVGPTSTRNDPLPIPTEYAPYYGQLNVGGNVGLSSGPVLAYEGQKTEIPYNDDRFKYRLNPYGGEELDNPRNEQAGVMTHAGDKNARAAITIKDGNVIMHTVTIPTMAPKRGATMAQWQAITMAGAGIRNDSDKPQTGSTLNLDGGGSVYMGIRNPSGEMRPVAKGQRAGETTERPVGNIIASQPGGPVQQETEEH